MARFLLLQLMKFLLRYAIGIMFGMFWFAFWVFSTQKCEAGIFTRLGSACVYTRPLRYLDALVLHRAHVPCMHVCVAHASHDVTWVHI